MPTRLAYVVSPHGFGHAARSAAVLNALHRIRPDVEPSIFTTVPEWFWRDSLDGPFDLHEWLTDVGMAQVSPIEEDPGATLAALAEIRPVAHSARPLAAELSRLECGLAVCDISPLGLAAAKLAGIPSVLIESFTWDWIYQAYFDDEPGLRDAAAEMAAIFAGADLRIQPEPVCRPAPGAEAVPPVFRTTRSTPPKVRHALEVDPASPIVLITMGGMSWSAGPFDLLAGAPGTTFVAFAGTPEIERRENVVLLPTRSPVYLPDLIAASEVVVGKLGYSTVAEAWSAGTRYAFIPRPRFPEGPTLGGFVRANLPSMEVEAGAFAGDEWLDGLAGLLELPRARKRSVNGADRIAQRLIEVLDA